MLEGISIVTGGFELVLQLGHGASRESKVLLGSTHLFAKSLVLASQLLEANLVAFAFLSALPMTTTEVVELVCQL